MAFYAPLPTEEGNEMAGPVFECDGRKISTLYFFIEFIWEAGGGRINPSSSLLFYARINKMSKVAILLHTNGAIF